MTKFEQYRKTHAELATRFLKIMIDVVKLESRKTPLTKAEDELIVHLRKILESLKSPQLKGLLSELTVLARRGVDRGNVTSEAIPESQLKKVEEFLTVQNDALANLVGVVRRDTKDVDLMLSSSNLRS